MFVFLVWFVLICFVNSPCSVLYSFSFSSSCLVFVLVCECFISVLCACVRVFASISDWFGLFVLICFVISFCSVLFSCLVFFFS